MIRYLLTASISAIAVAALAAPAFAQDAVAEPAAQSFGTWGVDVSELDPAVDPGTDFNAYANGRWIARGLLSGSVSLRVELPAGANVHKGRLMALRYDPSRFRLLPSAVEHAQTGIPTDVVPSLRDSR